MAPEMKYWNDSQPAWVAPNYESEDDDNVDDGSDMSEWASENEDQLVARPVFKSQIEGMLLQFKNTVYRRTHSTIETEWERKQRNREYRVAARREKRNRKADEKKQRKLNATILRRMVRTLR